MLKVCRQLASRLELCVAGILPDTSESLETSTDCVLDCLYKFGAFNSTIATLVFQLLGALIADSLLVELDEIAGWRLFCSNSCRCVFNCGIALYMQLVAQFKFVAASI